jgi:general secretion pathway protein D
VPVAADKVKLPALPPPYCPPACGHENDEKDLLSLVQETCTAGLMLGAGCRFPAPCCPAASASKDQCKEIQVRMQESQAGNLFGVGVNSDAGLTGSMVLNERNFDAIHPQPPQAPCNPGCCPVMRTEQPRKTLEEQLIKLIINTVQPESWKECGGKGTIEYYPPLGMALVIHQTADVQEQVADLLASLRRLQDVEVAVEVRIVTVPKAFLGQVVHDLGLKFTKCQKEGCGGPCPAACSKSCCSDTPCEGLALLDDSEVAKFFKKIQADPHTNVMQTPKMTMFNGQESMINIRESEHFVTSVQFQWVGDQVIFFPRNEPVSTGLEMTVQPVVSADQKYVRVSWSASLTQVDTPVPLCPITTQITPTFEGGAKGQPEPFTVFIQHPSLLTQRVKKTVCIPDRGTALLTAWTTCREVPEEVELPIVSRIPYVNELFKMVRNHEETTTTVMMVTPRIICSSEQEAVQAPASDPGPTVIENLQKLEYVQRLFRKAEQCRRRGQQEWAAHAYQKIQELCPGSRVAQMALRRCQQLHAVVDQAKAPEQSANLRTLAPAAGPKEAADLVSKYYQACSEGHWAEATQRAVQALALDPACFSKEKDKASHPTLNAN